MSIFELIILGISLAMDAFAVSICKGLSVGNVKIKHLCLAGLWFGGFQALMPLIGYLGGSLFAEKIEQYDHWLAFVCLVFIGANMIKESFESDEDDVDASMGIKTMFILAVATSIDALAVGVTFSFLSVNIWIAIAIIGAITFAISAVGVKIGSIFGTKYKSKAEIAGGVVLIILGIKILIEGLGIL